MKSSENNDAAEAHEFTSPDPADLFTTEPTEPIAIKLTGDIAGEPSSLIHLFSRLISEKSRISKLKALHAEASSADIHRILRDLWQENLTALSGYGPGSLDERMKRVHPEHSHMAILALETHTILPATDPVKFTGSITINAEITVAGKVYPTAHKLRDLDLMVANDIMLLVPKSEAFEQFIELYKAHCFSNEGYKDGKAVPIDHIVDVIAAATARLKGSFTISDQPSAPQVEAEKPPTPTR